MARGTGRRSRLRARLENAEGIERAEILYHLAGELISAAPDEAIEHGLEALKIVQSMPSAKDPDPGRSEFRGLILYRLAEAGARSCDHEASRDRAQQAARAFRESSSFEMEAKAVAVHARALMELGRLQEADSVLEESLADYRRRRGHDAGEVVLLREAGALLLMRSDAQAAIAPLTEAVSLAREIEDPRQEIRCLDNLGIAQLLTNEYDLALRSFDRALVLAKRLEDEGAEARTLGSRAQVLSKQGHFVEALEAAQRSMAYHRASGQPCDLAHAADLVAVILNDAGASEEAEPYARESLGYWRESGARAREATSLISLATACRQTGKSEEARDSAERAAAIAREVEYPIQEAYARLILGALHTTSGDPAEARRDLDAARELASTVEYGHLSAMCTIRIAELQVSTGENQAAIETLRAVWPIEDILTAPRDQAALHDVACRALAGAGDPAAALKHALKCRMIEQTASRKAATARLEHMRVKLRLDEALAAASAAGERAARRSAAQLAAIVENTPNVGIAGTDISGTVRLWNPAAELLTGWTAEEAVGASLRQLVIPPEDHEEYDELLKQLDRKAVRIGPRERRALRKDGTMWTGLITSFTIVTDDGERLAVHMVLDITDRVRLEEALRISEQRFSKAFFASPDSVTLSTIDDGRFFELNEGFEKVFGIPREDALGKSSLELGVWRHPSDRARMVEQLRAEGSARLDGVEYRHASGRTGVADVAMERIDVSGEPCLLTVVRDTTARMRAEEDLRAALSEVGRLKARLEAENIYLQEEIRRDRGIDRILGSSEAMRQLLTTARQVARTDATVLILGETGTGKELLARRIHDLSARREHTLVKVNCAAVSAGLVESELFGHEKGAFTGADRRREGRFELADGGSIFLDEIGELPLEVQVKLLRVLEEQEFERVGSSEPLRVDVRVIAVTNRDLEAEVDAGRFRADLYYRLNVFPMEVPPLRDRASDIPEMAEYFLDRVARRIGKHFLGIRPETLEWMSSYNWPGNVRELANFIERAAILAEGSWVDHTQAAPRPISPVGPRVPDSPEILEDVERRHILRILELSGWRIGGPRGAAERLGIHPSTLRSRMKKLGIRRG